MNKQRVTTPPASTAYEKSLGSRVFFPVSFACYTSLDGKFTWCFEPKLLKIWIKAGIVEMNTTLSSLGDCGKKMFSNGKGV